MDVLFYAVFAFLFGLCVGSFLNVCAWRIPRGESIVFPPSQCPKCHRPIKWYENIPILSYLALGRRCRGCREPISPRYFLIELATGLLFAAVYLKISSLNLPFRISVARLAVSLVVVSLSIAISVTDWEHRRIPNKLTYPAIIFGLAMAVAFPEEWRAPSRFMALGFACASTAFWGGIMIAMAYFGKLAFKQDALGWGDIKYVAAIAAAMGPRAAFFTVFAGSVIGTVGGLGLMVVRGKGPRMAIPFGPALAAGALLWIFIGHEAWNAYIALFRTP